MKISVLQLAARSLASAPTERQPMNISRRTNRPVWLAALALLMGGGFIHAQSLNALAGHWNGVNFNVPTQLVLDKNPQGKVVNVQNRQNFEVLNNLIDVTANGAFSGTGGSDPLAGTFAVGAQGVVTASIPGQPVISFRVNESQDFLASAAARENSKELLLLLRSPAALAVAELAGQWNILQFQTPAELIQVQQQPSGLVTDVQGGNSFESFSGSMTLNANGTFSGVLGDAFTGTLAVTGTGQVTATIQTQEGTFPLTLFVNAGKNLLLVVNEEIGPEDNMQEIILMSRAPATVLPADLAGAWKVNYFSTPAALTLQRDLQGVVTDISERNDFEVGQQTLTAGNDGFFTALIDDPAAGRFTINPGGGVGVTLTNSQNEVSSVEFKLNAAKDVLLAFHGDSENQEALVLTKSPAIAGNRQEFGLMFFGNNVVWAAGANRKLQSSGELPGGFEDVPGTTGLHAFPLPQNPTGSQFFQVVE